MFDNPLILLGISTLFAAIPAGIWLYILFSKTEKSRKTVALIFLLGCLTAPALLGLQYIWDIFPEFNLAAFIEENIQMQSTMYIAMFVLFGALEEIIKMYVITAVDKRTVLIQRVEDSIRYSLAAALGFSFTENIYYLFQFWPLISVGELLGMYIFRSIFTACAHMIFSGVFGYYYGIGKFSITISKQRRAVKSASWTTNAIAKIFRLPKSQAFQQKVILKGLLLAIVMHATFNYLLQFNILIPVIIFIVLGFFYLQYLLKRKTGHLVLTSDISEKSKSTIAKKDEEVVLELLSLWFKEQRFVDVIHVCERLLERDPDNNVVKLFKAKALDQIDKDNPYKNVLDSMFKSQKDLNTDQKNQLTKYLKEKEQLKKLKKIVKKRIEKEGKEYVDPAKEKKSKNAKDKNGLLDKYTGKGTFNINR